MKVAEEDIYFSFLYKIDIELEDKSRNGINSIKHVEITWCGHSFPDYVNVVDRIKDPLDVQQYMDENGGAMVLNYKFIRNFSKEFDDSWTINALNQFFLMKPNFID